MKITANPYHTQKSKHFLEPARILDRNRLYAELEVVVSRFHTLDNHDKVHVLLLLSHRIKSKEKQEEEKFDG